MRKILLSLTAAIALTNTAYAQPYLPQEVRQALRAIEAVLAGQCLTNNGCGAKSGAIDCREEFAADGRKGVTFCKPHFSGEAGRGSLWTCYDLVGGGCRCHEKIDAC